MKTILNFLLTQTRLRARASASSCRATWSNPSQWIYSCMGWTYHGWRQPLTWDMSLVKTVTWSRTWSARGVSSSTSPLLSGKHSALPNLTRSWKLSGLTAAHCMELWTGHLVHMCKASLGGTKGYPHLPGGQSPFCWDSQSEIEYLGKVLQVFWECEN